MPRMLRSCSGEGTNFSKRELGIKVPTPRILKTITPYSPSVRRYLATSPGSWCALTVLPHHSVQGTPPRLARPGWSIVADALRSFSGPWFEPSEPTGASPRPAVHPVLKPYTSSSGAPALRPCLPGNSGKLSYPRQPSPPVGMLATTVRNYHSKARERPQQELS
jgi:hypothetical protein